MDNLKIELKKGGAYECGLCLKHPQFGTCAYILFEESGGNQIRLFFTAEETKALSESLQGVEPWIKAFAEGKPPIPLEVLTAIAKAKDLKPEDFKKPPAAPVEKTPSEIIDTEPVTEKTETENHA